MKKVSTIVTVKKDGEAINYELPGTGQEVVGNFRKSLPKGSSTILRGFRVNDEKTILPVNLNSI